MGYVRIILVIGVSCACVALGGCKDETEEEAFLRDLAISHLKRAIRSKEPIRRDRAREALAKLTNHVRDTKPILVLAALVASDSGVTGLHVSCFDEDQDLAGWCIREQQYMADGSIVTLEERYPVYADHATTPQFFAATYSQISIRTEGQTMDKEAWHQFTVRSQTELTEAQRNPSQTDNATIAPEELIPWPPIWISVPNRNNLRVFVSIYDRAGHESDPYELWAPPTSYGGSYGVSPQNNNQDHPPSGWYEEGP